MFFKHSFDIADGTRLFDRQQDQLWLVFAGLRHLVACQQVHASLFVPNVSLQDAGPILLSDVPEGPDLLFGTSLVRREGSNAVHLLAVHPKRVLLLPIPTKETADRCGFDLALCRTLPAKVFAQIKLGTALS